MARSTDEGRAAARERRSPGLATLFASLREDGRHAVLDLGPASGAHLRVLGPFARQVRFASLLTCTRPDAGWDEALRALRPNPGRPYDVVLAWDALDRIDAERRSALVARLEALTAPKAWLYALTGPEGAGARALTFELKARDRVAERPVGVTDSTVQPLLPAHVERLLEPFEIMTAFMLRSGAREYVAVKRPSVGRRGEGRG